LVLNQYIIQCRCGPVTRPVWPIAPICSPRFTNWPTFTSIGQHDLAVRGRDNRIALGRRHIDAGMGILGLAVEDALAAEDA
jgi:hypothetical protein